MAGDRSKAALVVCAVLFVLALVLSAVFSRDDTGEFQQTGVGQVVLSEILASNRTYPDENGRYLDFIEIRNISNTPADISGYMLSDDLVSVGYTFPPDTVLPVGGYTVVWCDKDHKGDSYATFGISREGGETIYLYNDVNVVVDSKDVPFMNANIPLVRLNDGSWNTAQQATPGYENTEKGYAMWLHAMGGDSADVMISEVMTGNSCTVTDESGRLHDWVELYNAGNTEAVLDGAYLSNDPADPAKWQIPALTLQAGERTVIRCAGTEAVGEEATFALEREGCTIILTGRLGNTLSQTEVPLIERDQSWALQEDGTWEIAVHTTPGFENSENGYAAWLQACGVDDLQIVISEVMTGNRSTVLNAAGELCDWIELYNAGSEAAVLDGAWLSDDPADRAMWQISALTLQAGERAVICCSGADAAAGEADFALSGEGCSVVLSSAVGTVLNRVDCPRLDNDRSYALQEDGSYLSTSLATPGYENTEEGRMAWYEASAPTGALVISEVMPANNYYLRQGDANYYDWVELVNVSDSPVDLSQYALAEDPDEPWQLPQKTLQPGERTVIICSGKTELTGVYAHAPFALSGEECWVYVIGPDGEFSDYLRIADVPYRGTAGRVDGSNAVYYFTNPTPGAANGDGVVFISAVPQVLTAEGVYNETEEVLVELSGSGEIRYTLDGSVPTESSNLYTAPISLSSTAVIRAASFEEGKLHSDVVTASYIINENHTLPVLSLAADPAGFAGMYRSWMYEIETPCNLTLFENGSGFNIDCGVEMHGHTGLEAAKKSFKVNFRGSYGEKYLTYPVYGEGAPEVYSSLCIRAGQDYPFAMIREELFTTLCAQMTEEVLIQRSKYCVLYVNGEYRGIYCLKEAFSETYYAENHNVPEESVTMLQAPVGTSTEMYEIIRFADGNDMSVPENYAYITENVNIVGLIDWIIMEGYSTNGDVQQNLRYFKSTENGDKWQPAFYDLDWAWYYHNPFTHLFSYDTREPWQHVDLCLALMENPTFRQLFFERCAMHMENSLSNENVLALIDELAAQLAPEMEREKARWGGSVLNWEMNLNELRSFITESDHHREMVNRLRQYVGLTQEEAETYFARWAG